MSKNHYRNKLKTPWLVRIVFGSVTLAAIFAAFVVLQNRQVKQGDRINEAERAIVQLDKEIDMWEARIDSQLDRSELQRRLDWVKSDLEEISATQIYHVAPREEVPALPKVAVAE